MGSSEGLPFAPEGPEHSVNITSFWMADAPVTAEQYAVVTKDRPSQCNGRPDLPVVNISWFDAQRFCQSLSRECNLNVRLPSEAEWEYACRAGSTTQFHFGDSPQKLTHYAWFETNSGQQPAPIKGKQPNPWGLFDIIGNVWEWCADHWHEDYTGAPDDGSAWLDVLPPGQASPRRRCVRGGAWDMDAFRCRSSYRSYDWEDAATNRTGFRIVVGD
jgi:formylglycine-generating enzyme required for sulfatase activity